MGSGQGNLSHEPEEKGAHSTPQTKRRLNSMFEMYVTDAEVPSLHRATKYK